MFFRSCLCYFCEIYSNKERSSSFKNRDHANIIINHIYNKNVERVKCVSRLRARASPKASMREVYTGDVSIKLQLSLCVTMAS